MRDLRWFVTRCCVAVTPLVALGGCIIDEDDRCSENQVYVAESICACADGYVVSADGLRCDAVMMMETAAGLGDPCTTPADCAAPSNYCASGEEGDYCTTSACTSPADCEVGWYCDQQGAESFCHEPPTGLSTSCETDADCAGLTASLCESFVTKRCLLTGCTADMPCPSGYVCCDLTPTGFFSGTQCHLGDACMIGEMVP